MITRNKPIITVIIPVFNTSKYLGECLNSLREQTYTNFEVLMINDGSTDNSKKICNNFSLIDKRFLLIDQANHGPAYSRNVGLNRARGKFIFFVDSDDYVDDDLLRIVIKKMLLRNIDLFAFGYYEQFGQNKIHSKYENPNLMQVSSTIALYHLFRGSFGSYAWRFIAKKSLYIKNNIFFPVNKLYEDIATTYRLLGFAHNIYISSDELYYYRQQPYSITHADSSYNLRDMLETFPQMEQFIYKNYPILCSELYKFQFNTICMILIGILMNIYKKNKQVGGGSFTKQKIKLIMIRMHIFPLIVFLKSKI